MTRNTAITGWFTDVILFARSVRYDRAMPSVEMSAHSGTVSAWSTSAIAVDRGSALGSLALSVGVLCHVFADLGRWVARL